MGQGISLYVKGTRQMGMSQAYPPPPLHVIHLFPPDRLYYILSGGVSIYVARSQEELKVLSLIQKAKTQQS